MGYVFDFNDAKAYEKWLSKPANQKSTALENRLMLDILNPSPGKTALDIGCGTGASLMPLVEMGLHGTGLDPSPYMLDIASRNLGERVDLHRGFAEALPFEDNSFDYACLNTSLEFVEDPAKAISEAGRVAKSKIFLGVFNRYALKGIQLRIGGIFTNTVFNHARFYSVWELKQNIRNLMADVPITWRTTCHLPNISGKLALKIEHSSLLQRCPFGLFTGMVVTLAPRYITTPLTIPYRTKRTPAS
jgi:ubiquinone/menaquinone biosynthesis C-methylase UbiE